MDRPQPIQRVKIKSAGAVALLYQGRTAISEEIGTPVRRLRAHLPITRGPSSAWRLDSPAFSNSGILKLK